MPLKSRAAAARDKFGGDAALWMRYQRSVNTETMLNRAHRPTIFSNAEVHFAGGGASSFCGTFMQSGLIFNGVINCLLFYLQDVRLVVFSIKQ